MLYLIGVHHEVQYYRKNAVGDVALKFKEHIDNAIKGFHITIAGEELSKEAVDMRQADSSLLALVAEENKIKHIFCDPDSKTRVEIGTNYSDIALRFHIKSKGRYTPEEWVLIEPEEFRIREQYWFDKIKSHLTENVLFICGEVHVERFAKLLTDKGVPYTILSRDWHLSPEHHEHTAIR